MKPYCKGREGGETPAKLKASDPREATTPRTAPRPVILKRQESDDDEEEREERFSMEKLCMTFLERVGHRTPATFFTNDLINQTGMKKRRIYDLMNILEGCGFVRRTSKGAYEWYGFRGTVETQRKKEASSLSCLASKVKALLESAGGQIDFKHIWTKMVEEANNSRLKPNSIKRRVYECCKVLKVLGLVRKKRYMFEWIPVDERGRRTMRDTRNQDNQRQRKRNRQQGRLIEEIIRGIETEQQLQAAIDSLRRQFRRKRNETTIGRMPSIQ